MAEIHFRLQTKLAPSAVLAALTDFGPRRAKVWPNIDEQHFNLHGQGPGWAEVTEGSSVAGGVWEREKYSWDPTKAVSITENWMTAYPDLDLIYGNSDSLTVPAATVANPIPIFMEPSLADGRSRIGSSLPA